MRGIRGLMIGLGIAVALSGCAASASKEEIAAAGSAKRLTGPEVAQVLTGNSLTGRSKTGKSQWTEYYDPSGEIIGMWKSSSDSGKYSGTWKVDGDKHCSYYDESDEFDGCATVGLKDKLVYWFKDDGTPTNADRPATLITGRAAGL